MQVQRWAVLVLAVITAVLGGTPGSGVRMVSAVPSDDPPSSSVSTTFTPGSAQRGRSGDTGPVTSGGELRTPSTGTGRTTDVSSSDQLARAVAAAKPGDTIRMAAGTYAPVVISTSGTARNPITLTGPASAVITGSGKGYTLHMDGASWWQLVGFAVTGGGKGVMLDNAQHILLDSLDVGRTGDEAVHFRTDSSDNTIQRSTIHDTGLDQPQYGEGVYVGSARSNWEKITGGRPDLSMNNRVVGNTFRTITAENVDVKEGTSGTWISGNRFDGSATSGRNYADSIVDIKGYGTTVVGNVTTGESSALKNIIATHVVTDAATSGCGNTIEGNTTEGFVPRGSLVAVDKRCG